MADNKWANQVKRDLSSTPVKQLKQIGGNGSLPPISSYLQFTAPKEGAPATSKQLVAGMTILGSYAGSFTTKKFGSVYHKVQTNEGLVAVPGSGQLNSLMKQVAVGAEVQIVYNGKETIKKGNFAGKSAHSFSVAASDTAA
jgi:hypothetical protein